MGKSQRSKGKRGQREAANLLTSRDWILVETSPGQAVCDLVAIDIYQVAWAVEVKASKIINIPAFRKQAMEQAAKLRMPWMLMAKIDGSSKWLILRKAQDPMIWGAI